MPCGHPVINRNPYMAILLLIQVQPKNTLQDYDYKCGYR